MYLLEHGERLVSGNKIVLGVTLPAVSYQPVEFGASQVITAESNFLNRKIGLYFVALLKKQMYQFSYTNKPGLQIYKDMILSLPVKNNHENIEDPVEKIDFEYMEKCIRIQQKLAIKNVILWKDRR
jgi:hypothetical protein